MFASEQSMWHDEANEKTSFGGQLDEKNSGQKSIKKESGEDEFFGPTDKNCEPQESSLTAHHNPFIDEEMDYKTTIESDETSEPSNGDSEKEKFWKFLYKRAVHVLNVDRINSVLQAERLSVVEGYKELERQDGSLMPLESSQFQEDDEIVGMTVNMIQKDVIWYNEHHQQAFRELVFLQQQLFNQRIERNKYYGKSPNNKAIWDKKEMKNGTTW